MHPALTDAAPRVFWTDRPDAPAPAPPLEGDAEADLCVVGGGFTGLWAALLACEQGADPASVVVLEGERVAFGASGRNGGFVAASLTHGLANGASRWPGEIDRLERLGAENLAGIEATLARESVACAWERTGELDVAVAPWQVEDLRAGAALARRHGHAVELLDGEAVRARVRSPTFLAGRLDPEGVALCDPARLAWGLRAALQRRGVRVHERTRATALTRAGAGVAVRTAAGTVRARRVVLATSAFPPLVRRIRRYVAPVWDYVLASEPLDPAQRAAVGWAGREGWSDAGNRFHYVRLTEDDRILWGGWTRSTASAARCGPTSSSTRRPLRRWPSTSSRPSRSSRACASPTAGAGRSTRAAGSARSSAPRTAAASPTPPASPAWASAPAASGPASPSSCSTAAARTPTSSSCGPRPSPSRPSRCGPPPSP